MLCLILSQFFMFFTLIFGDNFFILANCVGDESCREKLPVVQISPTGPKYVPHTDFYVNGKKWERLSPSKLILHDIGRRYLYFLSF